MLLFLILILRLINRRLDLILLKPIIIYRNACNIFVEWMFTNQIVGKAVAYWFSWYLWSLLINLWSSLIMCIFAGFRVISVECRLIILINFFVLIKWWFINIIQFFTIVKWWFIATIINRVVFIALTLCFLNARNIIFYLILHLLLSLLFFELIVSLLKRLHWIWIFLKIWICFGVFNQHLFWLFICLRLVI